MAFIKTIAAILLSFSVPAILFGWNAKWQASELLSINIGVGFVTCLCAIILYQLFDKP